MQKLFLFVIELINWLKIVFSPLLIGVVIGIAVYINKPDTTGLYTGILIATLGLIIGVIWATYIWKKTGTTNYFSRLLGSGTLKKEENSK
jgi:FtsH-binding integral membrane protein